MKTSTLRRLSDIGETVANPDEDVRTGTPWIAPGSISAPSMARWIDDAQDRDAFLLLVPPGTAA